MSRLKTSPGSRARPPSVEGAPALRVQGLRKAFAGRVVLDGFDLAVFPGEVVALLGANGSGKSTALRCVVGLLEADAGEIVVQGKSLAGLRGTALADARKYLAMVFQQIHLVRRRSALNNVCAGALGRLTMAQSWATFTFPRDLREEAMAHLDRVGMADRAHDQVGRLSGGQQQRVAIARGLCQGASVILADEPVSALDPAAAEQVMALMTEIAKADGLAVAAVLHQPELARRHANRIVGLRNGRVEFSGPTASISLEQIHGLYAAPVQAAS